MFIKPADGRAVPDPYQGDHLPAEGREVEANQHWLRRIADGDVVEAERVQAGEAKPARRSTP